MNRKLLLLAVVLLTVVVLSACAGNGYYVARTGPPRPLGYGVMGVAPGPGYVWVDGFWDLRGGSWRWAPGYWARPPRGYSMWVTPSWRPYGHGYRYNRGYWR
jgi:hypothetical protein